MRACYSDRIPQPQPPPPCTHTSAAPARSHAWCGKPYPSWAYRIPFNDGSIKARITGLDKLADVFLRVIGKEPKGGADGVPPILLLPTIGMTHDYLETLEALTYGDRQVITFDPVGVGQSSRQLPAGLRPEADATEEEALRRWSAMVVEICKAVVEFLELKGTDLHILGHGAGAIPALVYAAELAAAPSTVGTVRSVTLAEPFLVGGKGALGRPYTAAAQPVPLCVSESVEGWGPVAAVVKAEEARGSLGGAFDGRWVASPAFDKLAGIPTFVSYGSKNEAVGLDEKAVQWIAARLPAGTQTVVKRFDGTALPHVDLPEAYADWVDENLQRAEGKMRPV